MKILIRTIALLLIVNQAFGQADPKDAQIDSLTKISKNQTIKVDSLIKNSKDLTKQVDSLVKNSKDLNLRIDSLLKIKSNPIQPVDSLSKSTNNSIQQIDSLSGELVKYKGVYNAIVQKVLHYNFDPTRSAYLIDSLKAARDSVSALFSKNPISSASADSLSILLKENNELKVEIDSLKSAALISKEEVINPDEEKEKAIDYLKQLKELLDLKIITEVEFLSMKKKYVSKL